MFEIKSKFCCRVDNIPVFVDSSTFELSTLLKAQPNHKLRGIVTDTQLYVWSTPTLIHQQMFEQLIVSGEMETDIKWIPLRFFLHDKGIDVFAYAKDVDRVLKNKIVLRILTDKKMNNSLLEM